ncbi:MAG: outer membrane protein assembly factor BamA [Methylobacterium sp.]|nr:outer membrane protein assembly factor BamA [Methylobacterium sp.]MCA3604429.1 outer membrane protein assembly factor BamA [Methylobacterium sp.]MCA3615300.1 outer membrane protein assembly factor BamA [Methylobacterium sp.]MCA4908839.1 outer membrane protein assembly factor BamA [Methylobacterium sp.]
MSVFGWGGMMGSVRKGLFAVMAALVLLSTVPAMAQQKVVVQGNSRVEADTIRSFVTLAPGESYTAARIDQAIKDLYATGLFRDVQITRSGSGVVVRVVENQSINRVSFVGNSRLKADQLSGEIQARSRGPFSQTMIDQDVQRIRDIYARAGRAAADVRAEITPTADGRVDVTFRISEGGKTGVAAINFQGNNAYGASRLKGVMSTTESNFLSFLKSSDVYDPDRIAADLEAIRRFYLRQGYADFRIVSSSAELDAAQNGYVINIVVEEGPRYSVSAVDVESRIADISTDDLRRQVYIRAGQTYNAVDVEKSVDALSRAVAQRGYAFAQVRPRGERNPADQTVRIVFSVEEGARAYIERIVIRGNTRTRDYVIRREFDVGEGDAFNRAAIDRAERRLRNLDFFQSIRVTTEPGSAPDRVVINVDVQDKATGSFSIAGGYSTSEGFLAEVTLQEVNFLGRGQFVRISASNGQRSRGGEFSFTEPFFLGYRLAAGFDLFTKFSDTSSFSRYQSRTTGFTLRAGVPITEEFSVGVRYTAFQQRIRIPEKYNNCAPGAPYFTAPGVVNSCLTDGEASVAIKEAAGNTVTSLAGLTFSYNTLDNNNDPTSGIFADLRPEIAGLGGDARFLRATATVRYYYPITDDFTGMLKLQGGYMTAFGSQRLRVLDHFYMGPDLVRGFAPSGIGPRDRDGDSNANAVGGTTYFGATAEVTFPIFGLPRELGLRGAAFADAGTLFGYRGKKQIDLNRDGQINNGLGCISGLAQSECLNVRDENRIRSSVGVGLLWASPLGPIRFDYAYALSRVTGSGGDRLQAFRFTGGARF